MAQVVVELSGDEAKLLKAYQKVRDAQTKVDDGLKKVKGSAKAAGTAAQNAGKQMQSGFGATAVRQLGTYVAGLASVTTGVQLLRGAMQTLREDTRRSLEVVESLVESGRGLNQILKGRARDVAGQQRNVLARETGVPLPELESLQFTAESLKMPSQATATIARAVGANLLGADAAGKVGGEVPLLFGGQVTSYQAIAGMLQAAAESPATFEDLAEYIPKAAEGAAQAGISPQETIAALSVMREKFDTATAAQRINRFTANLAADDRFQGKTLTESVSMLEAMPDEQRKKFLGESIQMRGAFTALQQLRPRIEDRAQMVQQATLTPEQNIGALVESALDPRFRESARNRARVERNRALRMREVTDLEIAAQGGLEREAASVREQERLIRTTADPMSRFVRGQMREFTSGLRLPAGVSRVTEEVAQRGGGLEVLAALSNVARALDSSSQSMDEAAENMRDATPSQRAAAAGVAE